MLPSRIPGAAFSSPPGIEPHDAYRPPLRHPPRGRLRSDEPDPGRASARGLVACAPSRRPARPAPRPLRVSTTPFAGAPATVRLALDWTPNTDHTGFYVARAKGWYARRRRSTSRSCPTPAPTPETLLAAHQAECGISFQDSMTFAVAAGADIVSVAAILQKTAIGDRRSWPTARSAAARPRRQDLRRLRLSERGPDAQGRHQGGRRQGRPSRPRPSTRAAYEALYNKQADFTIAVHRLGRRRGAGARDQARATSSSPTTASPTTTRSSSPATRTGSRRSPTSPGGSSARRSPGSSSRPTTRDAAAILSCPEPRASSTRTRTSRRTARIPGRRSKLYRERCRARRSADARSTGPPTRRSCTARDCSATRTASR